MAVACERVKASIENGVPPAGSDVRAFIDSHPQAQGVHSAAWCQIILQEVGGEFKSVVVRDEAGRVEGWMPAFIKHGPIGPVVNSSPFYGSHGGILALSDVAFDAAAAEFLELLRDVDALGANVIEPLADVHAARYDRALPVVATVDRFAHVKSLSGLQAQDDLLRSVTGLTRSNLKRRCWKSGIVVERDESPEALAWLIELHAAQMQAKNVQPKSSVFFTGLLGRRDDEGNGRLYVGRIDGRLVAAVFLYTWGSWVDYVTPVFDMEARHVQPLTAVIAEAMLACARDGFMRWNFGGSGDDLDTVVTFKETWGCEVIPYRYHIADIGHIERLKEHVRTRGTAGYRGYYLYPFKRT